MDIDFSPQPGPGTYSTPSGWAASFASGAAGTVATSMPVSTAGESVGGAPSTVYRPALKRGRTESPERASKRPALAHLHSLSAAHSPIGTPATPPSLQDPTAQDLDSSRPASPADGSVVAQIMKRDGSTEFVQRTQRLGLRTPLGEDGRPGGNTPVETPALEEIVAHPIVDLDMAMDVEMCEDLGPRPVLPIRRSSNRSALSGLTTPSSHPDTPPPFSSFSLAPGTDPLNAAVPGTRYYPLNRPHPVAFQQHLALSPRHGSPVNGAFPIMSGFEGVVKSRHSREKTRSPSPILLSPPVSPQVSIMMDRRPTAGSHTSSHSDGSSNGARMSGSAHNGFGFNGSTTAPGSGSPARFSMGPRNDCEKCRMKVPGHYSHVLE